MKKVFISADIEGTAFAATWESTLAGGLDYERNRQQMTDEVLAAAAGAREAGAELVVVKDAHGPGVNLYPEQMPDYVQLIRGWAFEPRCMVEGLDETFDAALFVGYHGAAGQEGNILSHTISGKALHSIRVNGVNGSEFLIYSYMAAYYGVPSVLLTGDKALCQESQSLHPKLLTVAVREDIGGHTQGIGAKTACKDIQAAAKAAVQQDLSDAAIQLPAHFSVELTFKDHCNALRKSYYPGATLLNPTTVGFESGDWYEVCRMLMFVVL